MPRLKTSRKSTWIDMTSMVDVCFLLLTFFMLATKFKADEAVEINPPSSVSKLAIPSEKSTINIYIDKDGRVFFGASNAKVKDALLKEIEKHFGLSFTQEERSVFRVLENFGTPLKDLKEYLNFSISQRRAYDIKCSGVPVTAERDANNELYNWILFTRRISPSSPITIKGDKNASIEVVTKVLKTLQRQKANRFSLITDLKQEPV